MNHDLASYSVICDISASRVSSNVTRLHLQKYLFLATEAVIKFQISIGQRSGSKIRIKSIKHVTQNYRHLVLHPTKSSCEMSTHIHNSEAALLSTDQLFSPLLTLTFLWGLCCKLFSAGFLFLIFLWLWVLLFQSFETK